MCCLSKLQQVIKEEDAKHIEAQMLSPNLTFVTDENKELLKEAAEMRSWFEEEAKKPKKEEMTPEARQAFEDAVAKAKERYESEKGGTREQH